MNQPIVANSQRPDRSRGTYPARIVREARLLAAANLGALGGFIVWLSVSSDGRAAEALTIAAYTAKFTTYRQDLISAARVPLIAYIFIVAFFAVIVMGLYELLAYGLTRFLGRRLADPSEFVSGGIDQSDRTA